MENEVHVFVLHYVFLPRINHVIASFVQGWNHHPLRSERNWSPERLWTNGMVDQRNHRIRHVAELFTPQDDNPGADDLEWFGMDWYAPSPRDDGLNTVEVHDVDLPFQSEILSRLERINPLSSSTAFGVDIYMRALELTRN